LKTAKPNAEVAALTSVPQNYIFVIDISASMEQEKRLDFVRTSIRELFNSNSMKKDDILGIIAFNHDVKTVLKATPLNKML